MMELLSPAGSYEALVAAVGAGADAVYMGGPLFGARAFADNPEGDALLRALDYVHLHGRKIYLTVNTLLKEGEWEEGLFAYMEPIYRHGIDGVIIQDMGVLAFLRDTFPNLPLHGSTQMAVSGPEGARLLGKRGLSRLVLPRELSLEEISIISREGGIESEVFVHGALCYAYSGQCLMSSFLGGRSGNRGRCAQPCRLPYEGGRLMNMRDLCGLDELPALQAAGVHCLKIEGRMKGAVYTAGVTAIYRKYLDQLAEGRFFVEEADRQALSRLFDRGGFTAGYYRQHNGSAMLDTGAKKTHVSLPEDEKKQIEEKWLSPRPLALTGRLTFVSGAPAQLDVSSGDNHYSLQGDMVQKAEKRPLGEEALRRQIEKSGGSPFVFEKLEIETDGASFLPLGALNALRRGALEGMQAQLLAPWKQAAVPEKMPMKVPPLCPLEIRPEEPISFSIALEDPALFDWALETSAERIFLPADYVRPEKLPAYVERAHGHGKKLYYCLPYIFRSEMRRWLATEEAIRQLRESRLDGVLIRSVEEIGFWTENDLPGERIFDSGLYTWNRGAEEEWLAMGAQALTLPLEVHQKDIEAMGAPQLPREQLIYGRVPLMLSAQCLFKTRGRCLKAEGIPAVESPQFCLLTDRTGAGHPQAARCLSCYSTTYNAVPLYLADMPLYSRRLRLHFTTETPQEAQALWQRIEQGQRGFGQKALTPPEGMAFTRGNYRRGVE